MDTLSRSSIDKSLTNATRVRFRHLYPSPNGGPEGLSGFSEPDINLSLNMKAILERLGLDSLDFEMTVVAQKKDKELKKSGYLIPKEAKWKDGSFKIDQEFEENFNSEDWEELSSSFRNNPNSLLWNLENELNITSDLD